MQCLHHTSTSLIPITLQTHDFNMSVYVITGVSKGIGVSITFVVIYIHFAKSSLVRARQADIQRPGESRRRSSPRSGYHREKGGS